MTSVTLLSPERASTGTQILVEDGNARLLFDCGLVFDPAGDPFAHVSRRPGRELSDLIRLGMAPMVPGLYAPHHLDGIGLPSVVPPSDGPTAVALSHSHLDHTHLVGFVDPAVPVYATPPTARILQVLSDAGDTAAPVTRSVMPVDPGQTFQLGPMHVRFVPVDHDVAGAAGLLIETSDGVIAYSGDIRLHGAFPERTLGFARAAADAGARLLILEGNRLSPPPDPTLPLPPVDRVEVDVAPAVARALLEHAGGLGIILLTPENGERVEAIAGAAAEVGRRFVVDLAGLAFVLAALGRPPSTPYSLYVPPDLESILALEESLPHSFRSALEAALDRVTTAEIAAQPGRYLLLLPFPRFADLLDLGQNECGGVVIRANGPPLGPFDPAFGHMTMWAERLGLSVVDAGSTGHAAPRDLALVAGLTRAPTVMAVHSRFPELLPIPAERLLLPERGRRYELAQLP